MRLPIICFISITSAVAAYGQPAEPHVHGSATVQVALSGTDLAISLKASGSDLVGFEHPATEPDQQKRVDDALAVLETWTHVVFVDVGANCVQQAANVSSHGFEPGNSSGHADFEAEYTLTCELAPSRMELTLFANFPGVEQAEVEVIGPPIAIDTVVTPSNPGVSW